MEIKLPNNIGNIELTSFDEVMIESPYDLGAEDFLEFAQEDIKGNKDKDIINALGNTKRAIENRVDLLHYAFGFRNSKEPFPKKLERLDKLGVVAPGILRKINTNRNLLEHKYKLPDKEEVEDAIDICILFIEYTNKFINHFISKSEGLCDDDGISIRIEEDKIEVIFRGSPPKQENFFLTNKDSSFYDWVQFVFKNFERRSNGLTTST